MLARLNKSLLLAVTGGLWMPTTLAQPQPPLLQTLETLACAVDSPTAAHHLQRLFNISPAGQQWPDEWLGKRPAQPSLHAGTLDIALHTLQQTATRFPDLRETAERVALQWDYCEVLDDQQFYDVSLQNAVLQKQRAGDVPLKWEGFRQWGFLTPDPTTRFVPLLLDEIRIAPPAYHLFLHRIYRQQCFPHPETGLLVREAETAPAWLRPLTDNVEVTAATTPFPFNWQTTCPVTPIKTAVKAAPPALASKPAPTVVKTAAPQKSPASQQPPIAVNTPVSPITLATTAITPAPPLADTAISKPAPMPKVRPPSSAKNAMQEEVVLPAILAQSAAGEIPMYQEMPDNDALPAHGMSGIASRSQRLRIAGSVADSVSLKDGSNSVSASVTWSPKPDWFISGNASLKDGEPGYAWSAGYANNKPGGWSVQANNWGPLQPGEGLALKKTTLNIGHKIKSRTLSNHKLAASANLGIPASGKPSLSGTLQWNPKPKWYARTTASVPLSGGNPNWTYAFGYADPRPGKWRVEYSNYGTNAFPGDNLNQGAVTVSQGWQF